MAKFSPYLFIAIFTVAFVNYGVPRLVKHLTFHPKKYPAGDWDTSKLPWKVEEVWITTSDNIRLLCWYLPKQGTDTVVLYLHGNSGNITERAGESINLVKNLPFGVFMLSYRGYGKSQGSPSEAGVYLDAMAGYKYIKKTMPKKDIVIYGHSLGAAIAVELATKVEAAALILEAPFTSLEEIGHVHYPLLPAKLLAEGMFNSISKIGKIRYPKMIIHGDEDEVIPYQQGKKLYDTAEEPKTFYRVKKGDHNNLAKIAGMEYIEQWHRFLKEK